MLFRTTVSRLFLSFVPLLLFLTGPTAGHAQCLTASPGAQQWQNESFPAQTAKFNAHWEVTPHAAGSDVLVALSQGPQRFWTGLAAIVRFHLDNTIDVRNGNVYAADVRMTYTPQQVYQVRMEVDVPLKRYSVYVTPKGGREVKLATNYVFRTEQQGVTRLDNWVLEAEIGSGRACFFELNQRWKAPETISLALGSNPDVAMDGNGNAMAVWQQEEGGRPSVYANYNRAGAGWGTPVRLASDASDPRVGMDAAGNAIAIWNQLFYYSTIFANRYTPAAGWGMPEQLETLVSGHPRIAVNANGNAVAVWEADTGGPVVVNSRHYIVGSGWTPRESLTYDFAHRPEVALDPSGKATVVWEAAQGIEASRAE